MHGQQDGLRGDRWEIRDADVSSQLSSPDSVFALHASQGKREIPDQ